MKINLMINKLFIILTLMLITCSVAYGAEINTSWAPYSDPLATELRIYDKDNNMVWSGPTTATTATFEVPNECGSWYITGANEAAESKNSNIINWCPGLAIPQGFTMNSVVN